MLSHLKACEMYSYFLTILRPRIILLVDLRDFLFRFRGSGRGGGGGGGGGGGI